MDKIKEFTPPFIGNSVAKATKRGGGTAHKERLALLGTDDRGQYVAIKTIQQGSWAHLKHRVSELFYRRWAPVKIAGREGLTFVNINSLVKRCPDVTRSV